MPEDCKYKQVTTCHRVAYKDFTSCQQGQLRSKTDRSTDHSSPYVAFYKHQGGAAGDLFYPTPTPSRVLDDGYTYL